AQAEDKRGPSAHWMWGIAAVGIFSVLGGVISLIAANWNEIPDALKLAVGFALLISSAWGARVLAKRDNTWPSDLLLLAHQGLVLAMIGLVAQIYDLSGAPWRPLALTAAFAALAAHAGRRVFLAHVAILFALAAVAVWCEEQELSFTEFALISAALAALF